jgi:hypothetical protein
MLEHMAYLYTYEGLALLTYNHERIIKGHLHVYTHTVYKYPFTMSAS